ncbi:hypothetical protein WT60_06775 [Burkholderia sp. MSMB617WGS]|nr:hypothetical protein WT60_06775 [Burkholderia sp. MSMB617WGS]
MPSRMRTGGARIASRAGRALRDRAARESVEPTPRTPPRIGRARACMHAAVRGVVSVFLDERDASRVLRARSSRLSNRRKRDG